MMFISSVYFYTLHSPSQSQGDPITIDAKKNYAIIQTRKANQTIQKIYIFTKWILPTIITYGSAHVFQFNKTIKFGLVATSLIYSFLGLLTSRLLLPTFYINRILFNDHERSQLRKNRVHFLSQQLIGNHQDNTPRSSYFRLPTLRVQKWKVLSFCLQFDDIKIDGILVGKNPKKNKRWILYSGGSIEPYERCAKMEMLNALDANGLFFNYPGVMQSSGPISKKTLVKTYQTLLRFLESENGIGAKEIIGYGYSLGGGVQAEGLNTHPFKKGIRYYFIKDRTFARLSNALSTRLFKKAGTLIQKLGWEMDCVASSKKLLKLKVPEIIIQTVYQEEDVHSVTEDPIISKEDSLMYQLQTQGIQETKYFLGTKESHFGELDYSRLSELFRRISNDPSVV